MIPRTLKLGTRGSALAMTQSGIVARSVEAATGRIVELVQIRTEGDINLGPLATIGGTGVFVAAVRAALAAGEVDLVVHSCKDLPTAPVDGITLAVVPPREDPSDALCARDDLTLDELPLGSKVGTGSPRRAAQLLRLRPDLTISDLRGNVPTRLGKVSNGELDAVVLAASGLNRLSLAGSITQILTAAQMLPAPGQGALAVECRTADVDTDFYQACIGQLDDFATRACIAAERSFLAVLEAGCTAPVGALATISGDEMTILGAVFAPSGSTELRGSASGFAADAEVIGADLASQLLAEGAAALMATG
ncbi:hydroxymethylbilane synthase [Nakamurella antarctica]|uniref:hydroxymethylbilane synthase n=1 Tax=Nakamurella antarctica TaxID=1902245 RepID=UPI001EF0DE37|nr:hydroxymethylbilane synthase [Nakamurella antarctica]